MNIKLRAQNLIDKYHTRNPITLARKLGIEVIYTDLGDVRGFFKVLLRRKFIFINSEMTEFEQKLVCGHELGHAFLHSSKKIQFMLDHTRIARKSKLEDEANLFMKYLIFDDDCEECICIDELKKIDYWTFEELKRL